MNTNQSLWYFEEVDFVNLFCPQKIVELEHHLKHKTYQKGAFIYLIDEPSDHMYIIKEGRGSKSALTLMMEGKLSR